MRSPQELSFRARQEAGNLLMLAWPPSPGPLEAAPLSRLPEPGRVASLLRGTPYAAEVESIAAGLLAHRFPLLGLTVNTGPRIEWRRDYCHGMATGTPYFRRVPYLDFARAGDHKIVWELNRHQHLVLLAQAYHLTGRYEFLTETFRHLESWLDDNPFLRGINWTSALEVAFRALSWLWVWHLAADRMSEALRQRFATGLYRHGCFLERNLSVYFSPNTHLLGEAVALHALGLLFPQFPRAGRWAEIGGRLVGEQFQRQVRPDGSHFEQSAYYHLYALDLFLFHYILAGPSGDDAARLARMAEYLCALMGPSRILPSIGDDDGGRLFHPYGERVLFGRATLATCGVLLGQPAWIGAAEDLPCQAAWWLGERALAPVRLDARRDSAPVPPVSRLFPDAGMAVMAAGENQVLIKAGPFGEGSGGHSHADVLTLLARHAGRELLIDPGTYTYVADPQQRDQFRGSAAHNTIRIDGRDQALPAGPFRWDRKPHAALRQWDSSSTGDFLDAACSYAGFQHRRRVWFLKPDLVFVLDDVEGPPGEHGIEQFWHLDTPADAVRLSFATPAVMMDGWRSRAFASREAAPVLRVAYRGPLPAYFAAVLNLGEPLASPPLECHREDDSIIVEWQGLRPVRVCFPAEGLPRVNGV